MPRRENTEELPPFKRAFRLCSSRWQQLCCLSCVLVFPSANYDWTQYLCAGNQNEGLFNVRFKRKFNDHWLKQTYHFPTSPVLNWLTGGIQYWLTKLAQRPAVFPSLRRTMAFNTATHDQVAFLNEQHIGWNRFGGVILLLPTKPGRFGFPKNRLNETVLLSRDDNSEICRLKISV